MTAAPRHHTPRDPSRPTRGHAVATVARAKGRPLMGWQQRAADVTHEVDPATGLYVYGLVIVSVPRQSGKTKLESDVADTRCLTKPRARVWITMQNGKTVDSWMREEHFTDLAGAAAFGVQGTPTCRYQLSKRAGNVGVMWPSLGSSFLTFPPKRDALHSKQSDDVFVDEAWAHNAEAGADIRQAVRPTMATRPDPRLWIVSTMGDDSSVFLDNYIELGKASLHRPGTRVCFIDYGVPEDVVLPDDRDELLELVAAHHPAYCPHPPQVRQVTDASPGCRVCGGTITMQALLDAHEEFLSDPDKGGLSGFIRAYGNRPTRTRQAAIPPAVWNTAGRPQLDVPERVGLALDVSPSGDRAAVGAAWRDGEHAYLELLHAGPAGRELPQLLVDLARARRVPIAVDRGSYAALEVVDAVAKIDPKIGEAVRFLSMAEYAQACGTLERGVRDDTVHHFHDADLTAAVEVATKRDLGDGGFGWGRKHSAGSIVELVAVTVALKAFDGLPAARRAVARGGRRR